MVDDVDDINGGELIFLERVFLLSFFLTLFFPLKNLSLYKFSLYKKKKISIFYFSHFIPSPPFFFFAINASFILLYLIIFLFFISYSFISPQVNLLLTYFVFFLIVFSCLFFGNRGCPGQLTRTTTNLRIH